jgi:hypothetical protein
MRDCPTGRNLLHSVIVEPISSVPEMQERAADLQHKRHTGVASLPETKCSKREHSASSGLTLTACVDKKIKQKSLTDHSLSVLCVLGFLTVGDGGSETQHLLGVCDLPNHSTMEKRSSARIEHTSNPVIMDTAEDVLFQNLISEAKRSNVHNPEFSIDR